MKIRHQTIAHIILKTKGFRAASTVAVRGEVKSSKFKDRSFAINLMPVFFTHDLEWQCDKRSVASVCEICSEFDSVPKPRPLEPV